MHSTDVELIESPPHPLRVCMSFHHGKSCSNVGRVVVLNDPPVGVLTSLKPKSIETPDGRALASLKNATGALAAACAVRRCRLKPMESACFQRL